ncbi:hypothetical protein IMX26_05615 [Clostridium sp. 'deep sea']|uniref:hypothetical protein n=1 Tax=Clostridium sp. 'deep sea' TaxID=2779445 RepID=UPI0018964EA9|nr:hypothetical protein [Clostridium sp. 'deep sea']QOR36291.1 hypothetical protein IMX26_05615 [Clostridium sp. 'deep sea']
MTKSNNKIFITGQLNNFTYQEAENIISKSNNTFVKDINKANIVVVGHNFNEQIIMQVQDLFQKQQAPLLVAEDFLDSLCANVKLNVNLAEHKTTESTVDLRIQKLLSLSHTTLLQTLHILNVIKAEIAANKLIDEVLT